MSWHPAIENCDVPRSGNGFAYPTQKMSEAMPDALNEIPIKPVDLGSHPDDLRCRTCLATTERPTWSAGGQLRRTDLLTGGGVERAVT